MDKVKKRKPDFSGLDCETRWVTIGKVSVMHSEIANEKRRIVLNRYVKLSPKKIARSEEILPEVMADFDKDGNLVGLEFV